MYQYIKGNKIEKLSENHESKSIYPTSKYVPIELSLDDLEDSLGSLYQAGTFF